MALMQCPECSKQVSEFARFCPACGYQKDQSVAGNIYRGVVAVGAVLAVIGILTNSSIVATSGLTTIFGGLLLYELRMLR